MIYKVFASFISIGLLFTAPLLISVQTANATHGTTEIVSVSNTGTAANNMNTTPTISSNGRYVAFRSFANNLVANDTNNVADIFLHDRLNDNTERVNVDNSGNQADKEGAETVDVSTDGRYVTFWSSATNLVPGGVTPHGDVYLRDLLTNTTERISVSSTGEAGDNQSAWPSMSDDGRYVAFRSSAFNLVSEPANGYPQIYVRDRQTMTTTLVSVSPSGALGNGQSNYVSTSADGRYIAFSSQASNLVPGDTNGFEDIFVRDLVLGTTTRVSVNSSGIQANEFSAQLSISGDGNYVAFRSIASNLVPNDTNDNEDLFVHNNLTGETERVSTTSSGGQITGNYNEVSINGDGRYVTFATGVNDLVPNDTNNAIDVFIKDRVSGSVDIVSVGTNDTQGTRHSYNASIDASGKYIAFRSGANNLVDGDTNLDEDIFVRDLTPVATPTPTETSTPTPTPTPTDTPTPTVTPTPPTPQLSSLSPAKVWMSKGLLDIGVRFDVKAEAYKDNVLVSSGQVNSVQVGSGGFTSANLLTIPFNAFSPVNFPTGSALKLKVYARNACTGSLLPYGTAQLWFNDSQANSRFDATIGGSNNNYYLRNNYLLTTAVGNGPRQSTNIAAGFQCSSFKNFGTWTITP